MNKLTKSELIEKVKRRGRALSNYNEAISRIGQKFNMLTIKDISVASKLGHGKLSVVCSCECGNDAAVNYGDLKSGHTKSCGCLHRRRTIESHITHGESGSITYSCWRSVISRCTQPTKKNIKNYISKGITFCDKWGTYEGFAEDMGQRPSLKHTIDRIDNSLGYFKENCRWATYPEQNRNKKDNNWIELGGIKMVMQDWCDLLKVNHKTIRHYLKDNRLHVLLEKRYTTALWLEIPRGE